MKKKILIISGIILLLIICLLYCYSRDNIRFKISYEIVNYSEYSNHKKIKVKIPLDNRIKYINESKLLNILKNDTAIIYMGYSSCPWCRNSIPILIDRVKKNNVKTLYYVDVHSVNIENKEIYKILDPYLKETDDNKKVIAVPDVYAVKKGKIVAHHRGCVQDYKNPYEEMTDKQKKELENIYDNLIKEIK